MTGAPGAEAWRRDPALWASIAGVILLWGSAFAGIRAGMRLTPAGPGPGGFGPGELALLRFGTASLALGLYAAATRMPLPRRADLPQVALAGFLGVSVYHLALNFGEVTVQSAAAALLIAAAPAFTALLSVTFLGDRLTAAGWGGLLLAFTGVALLALGGGGQVRFTPGALLILLAAGVAAVYTILSKRALRTQGALAFTCHTLWAGTLPMLAFLPGLLRQWPAAAPSAAFAGLYLGLFPAALAYLLWNRVLARMPVPLVASFLYLSPVVATGVAWLWLGEVPSLLTVAGGAVAVAGVAVVQLRGRRPAAA